MPVNQPPFPLPDASVLEAWKKRLSDCMGYSFETIWVERAYYFLCGQLQQKQESGWELFVATRGKGAGYFSATLDTFPRELLFDALCLITISMEAPTYGSSLDAKAGFDLLLKQSPVFTAYTSVVDNKRHSSLKPPQLDGETTLILPVNSGDPYS